MSKAELVHQVAQLNIEVRRALYQYVNVADAWMAIDITIPQIKTILFIASQGTTNTRQIAEELGVTSSNMTGIIDRLVKENLVSRQENPVNRRMYELRLTEEGENLLAGMTNESIKCMSEVLTHMSNEDLTILSKGLTALLKAATTYRQDI